MQPRPFRRRQGAAVSVSQRYIESPWQCQNDTARLLRAAFHFPGDSTHTRGFPGPENRYRSLPAIVALNGITRLSWNGHEPPELLLLIRADPVVRARIDSETKKRAPVALEAMGLSVSDALRLLMLRIASDQNVFARQAGEAW